MKWFAGWIRCLFGGHVQDDATRRWDWFEWRACYRCPRCDRPFYVQCDR